MILCKKNGIKCKKIRNGFGNPFQGLVMQENTLDDFKCKKIGGNNSKMCVCSTVKIVK